MRGSPGSMGRFPAELVSLVPFWPVHGDQNVVHSAVLYASTHCVFQSCAWHKSSYLLFGTHKRAIGNAKQMPCCER